MKIKALLKLKGLVTLLLIMGYLHVSAQETFTVKGTVTDKNNEPIIGATIIVQGNTSKGTVTNIDGEFIITQVPRNATLLISYVGMKTASVPIEGKNNLDIVLQDDSELLDEVVVTAYGTTKRSSFTGSASVVKSDQLEKISGSGFVEALQGMSAGVNVVNNEGNPGGNTRIQIRGIGSMSGNTTPLYVVDGMPYDGALTSLSPSDIESMTVLKDAAASSLYGSRAANGVVVITTKKGKSDKPTVNVRMAWGTSDNAVANPVKASPHEQLMNTWRAIYNDQYYVNKASSQVAGDYATANTLSKNVNIRRNSQGVNNYVTPFAVINEDYVLHDGNGNAWTNPNLRIVWDEKDYDWYGAVFSRKLRQDYGIDVSGMSHNGKTSYFTSATFLDDKGYANKQYYKRYSFRANVTSEINNWLTMGGNLTYSYSRQNVSGANRALVFSNTLNSPWLRNADNTDWVYSLKTGNKMYDFGTNNANFFGIHVLNNGGDYWNNPNDESFNNNEKGLLSANYFAELKLPLELKFRTAISIDDVSTNEYGYSSAVHGQGQLEPYGVTVMTNGGSASRTNNKIKSLTWNNLLTWEKNTEEHNINFMLGHEFYKYNRQYNYGYGEGIMQIAQFELASTTKNWEVNSFRDRYALLSFFGRGDYNYQNKYYLSTSFRRDGSSRFSPTSRWGNFYSAGASWRISNESFFHKPEWLDNLSFRGSYGTTGNDKLITRNSTNGSEGNEILYAYQGYYDSDDLYDTAGYKPISVNTPNLKWEKNEQYNLALDFALFGKINGSVEFYNRSSKDLLYYKELPLSAQVGDAEGLNTNLGNIRNRGFELTINATPVRNSKFTWNIDANFSTLKNEVTYLPGGAYIYSNRVSTYRLEEGYSLFEFYMVKNAGVNPENGNMRYWVKDGNNNWVTTEDYSEVSTDDYQYCGSAIPKAFGSITNSFKLNNFDFSFMWYASFGSKMFDYVWLERTTVRNGVGVIQELVDGKVWMKPGDNAVFPRWSASDYSGTRRASDFYLFNNDYFRLRNVTLGYSLPKKATSALKLNSLRAYISGDNLLTFGSAAARYSEPETGVLGNNYNGNANTDNGIQGSRRVYMIGIQVSF